MRRINPILMIVIVFLVVEGPLRTFARGGPMALLGWITDMILVLPGIIIGLSFHEYAHAKAAVLCGDSTPLYQGRVSLDPRAHIDPMGLISLLFIHFGWGKPVMINPRNFKNPRRDSIIVGLAGVFVNFLIAVFFGFVIRLVFLLPNRFLAGATARNIISLLLNVVVINISLMLFNLLPIPPLDGFGVLVEALNLRRTAFYDFMNAYGMQILMLCILFNVPGMLLSRPVAFFDHLILGKICGLPFM